MNIVLMRNKSAANYLTKNVETLATVTGNLTADCSVINPAILLDGDITMRVKALNYFHIPDFGRYYFVTGMTTTDGGLWLLEGHVDVLVSFRDSINPCKGVVARNETSFNQYFNDWAFTGYQNPKNYFIRFPNGFTTQEFVLALAGNQS